MQPLENARQRFIFVSPGGLTTPLFRQLNPVDTTKNPQRAEYDWPAYHESAWGRLQCARVRVKMATGSLPWWDQQDNVALCNLSSQMVEGMRRACVAKYLLFNALRVSERSSLPDTGDLMVLMSIELEATKVLLALERRLSRSTEGEDLYAELREVKVSLEGVLNNFLMISRSPSESVLVWCQEYVDQQCRTLSYTLRCTRPSVSEVSARGYRGWMAICKEMDASVYRPAPGALGLLLAATERRALGMEDIIPFYPDEISEAPGAVSALLNHVAELLV